MQFTQPLEKGAQAQAQEGQEEEGEEGEEAQEAVVEVPLALEGGPRRQLRGGAEEVFGTQKQAEEGKAQVSERYLSSLEERRANFPWFIILGNGLAVAAGSVTERDFELEPRSCECWRLTEE